MIPLLPGKKTVECKWTYKKKQEESGNTVPYKARLVVQGFTQQYGTDYVELFAPVARQTTVRTLLTISMVVQHLDIKTAYLYAD